MINRRIYSNFLQLKVVIPVISIIISSILLLLSFKYQWIGGKFIAIVIISTAIFWIISLIWSERKIKYIFIIPTTILLIVVTIIPFIYLLSLSVHDVTALNFNKEWNFIGLKNYIFKDTGVLIHLILTIEFILFAVVLEFIIGMGLALLLNREFVGKKIVFPLLLIPIMTTPVVVGMMWKYMFAATSGLVNQILKFMRLPGIPWLSNHPLPFVSNIPIIGAWLVKNLNLNYGFLAVIITDVWQWTPFMFLVLLAGLSSIPSEPYEAAAVDGANYWQTFRYITLPLMQNIILISVLLRIMDAMKVFDTIWALFGNTILMRPLNMYIFNVGINMRQYSIGAAASILVLILVSVISTFFVKVIYSKYSNKRK